MVRIRIRITGRVQGVGFRYFVRDAARKYYIKGLVKNNSDGSLEIDAESTRTNILSFIEEIKRGPAFSKVDQCETAVQEKTKGYSAFRVE
ncbi:MAG: hypothetical protein A3F26_01280 [Candidatus Ryanbacteria bacterium RIFCSPHIGHO2_12_FULL_47_12b]|uniref:acylphosphatase n=2 Tax=Candidatus Ryaniibacteriota TaxID=1817914 RepID=A0A1G2H457_9BACT|nr:MAG: hypothetical protein A2844_00625 [Candidatus Ryanbacteria bacterium RIFCSPHIGHO2_01_FULL_48_80]OGZ49282.1 MAG: hypothetical protein A3C83_00020 [Candidatus Ryanbacteria bacterium RIFCSPHIGHO2_02_FULL_47_25]OGZ51983.1 MAG: hypothetical protein A3A29_02370 [Candidatus Ryanbacteria bacterium RIFCSPLOWO2_01_FULL_47_79]OGZ52950.1 MAG: hypothetical protein A3F26_01280 [Candidatus Ryanbacteria bacterium RIFCSPHIGHO2_12_FULL_47_12b]OGZ55252.1 MAG: hypothetical protein A3J04_02280 [Candidatus Ry